MSNQKNCDQIFLYTENFTQELRVPQRYGGRQHQNQKRMIQSVSLHDIVTCFGRTGALERVSERLRSSFRSK
jgi:hypothetical protein